MSRSWLFTSSCISSPASFSQGSCQMHPELEKLKDKTATVTGLWVYTTPLRQSPVKFIKHDFLVLRMSIVVKHQNSRRDLLIRAEKYNNNDIKEHVQDAGISVTLINDIEEEDVMALFSAEDLNVTIKIADLSKILTSFDPDYDLFGDNCWKYASVASKKLLEKFRQLGDEDRIGNHLKKIHRPWMPMEVAQVGAAGVAVGAVAVGIGALVVAIAKSIGSKEEEEEEEEEESDE